MKERVENPIDAGATEIVVAVERSGKRLIRITDNGCGMSREDILRVAKKYLDPDRMVVIVLGNQEKIQLKY